MEPVGQCLLYLVLDYYFFGSIAILWLFCIFIFIFFPGILMYVRNEISV